MPMRQGTAASIACALALAVPALAGGAANGPPAALADLVEVERTFARASATGGAREAFLEYLADGAVVLRPHAIDAREWYLEGQPIDGYLEWFPMWADVAADGTLGYTTGPWDFQRRDPLAASSYGHYVAVWKKQADGAWRVVVDLGTTHPPPKHNERAFAWPEPPAAPPASPVTADAAREELLGIDRAFATAAAQEGTIPAYERHASKQLRLYRNDRFPALGWKAARSVLKGEPGSLSWEPLTADVAASGDLGYTYGSARRGDGTASDTRSYVRIWRRDEKGAWSLVLDIMVPAPSGK